MKLDIVEQEQIGLLYISEFRSSSKWGGGGAVWLNQTLKIRVAGLKDNFSWLNGPQSCLKNKEAPQASPEPLSGPRSAVKAVHMTSQRLCWCKRFLFS